MEDDGFALENIVEHSDDKRLLRLDYGQLYPIAYGEDKQIFDGHYFGLTPDGKHLFLKEEDEGAITMYHAQSPLYLLDDDSACHPIIVSYRGQLGLGPEYTFAKKALEEEKKRYG
ncbi:MAG: hypothetical protein ACOC32_02025 [Nanoarchaeota archaeon]